MNCSWTVEEAQRYAEGSLAPEGRQAFADHLRGCAGCRARVAEAERLEQVLKAAITPLPAPATLASRVANAVAAERVRRPRFAWPLFSGRRALSPVLAGLALLLALSVVSYIVAPGAAVALAQRVLFFIPGLGIKLAGEGTLVATEPVTVQQGGTTFTVEALLANSQGTTVKFTLSGLPGGKQGWDSSGRAKPPILPGSEDDAARSKQGWDSGGRAKPPVLRDAAGREYTMTTAYRVVDGSPEENIIKGEWNFQPLPGDLRSIDLVAPMDYLVPPTVLPGSDTQAWVAHITLAPPAETSLPAATLQSAVATVRGVTLQVAASTAGSDRTVVLVEGKAEGAARVTALSRMGADPTLVDGYGRRYPILPQGSEATIVQSTFRKDLYFAPLAPFASQLTLRVPAVQVNVEGSADVTIPLKGHKLGDTWALNRSVELGGHTVSLKSATLGLGGALPGDAQTWLYVDVDLGGEADGRTLVAFNAQRSSVGAAMRSMGKDSGAQMDRFGVPVEPGDEEAVIHLSLPIVVVEGPWELTFPAGR